MSEDRNKKAFLGSNYTRNIGYIEEVLSEILCRLPCKQIADSKLVSKFWNNLIGEQQFAQQQFSCSREQKYILYPYNDDTQKTLYLVDRTGRISPYVTLPSIEKNTSLKLICSFNGLLCFTKSLEDDDLDIYICNPVTREILKLPKGSPSTVPPSIGIVFEANKIKYKVLRFFFDDTFESKAKCEIYSPGDVEWRVIDEVVEPPVINRGCPVLPTTICVGGRMYWLVWSTEDAEKPGYILSIDMDENITRIRLPELNSDESEESSNESEESSNESEESSNESNFYNSFTVLIEYKGSLGLVSWDDDQTEVTIWLLENLEEELSWGGFGEGFLFDTDVSIYAINNIVTVENELLFVLNTDQEIFHFLNLDKKTWRVPGLAVMCAECNEGIDILRKLEDGFCGPVVFPFSESLLRCDATD